jgi:leucyl aminopeptidase
MSLTFADPERAALPLHAVWSDDLERWLAAQPEAARAWASAHGWKAGTGKVLVIPAADGADGAVAAAAIGLGKRAAAARERFTVAAARRKLPAVTWRLAGDLAAEERDEAALGWLLAGYRYDRYVGRTPASLADLVAPEGCDAARLEAIAAGEALTRDLINTPALDMGPSEVEVAARALAAEFGAEVEVTTGEALISGFPLIATVGAASARAPRLIEMRHGTAGPRLTLVGKGVAFDTGGLNIKPSGSMALMKKDMGGAAAVLGLARMILATGTEMRLRVLIPAVENAIAGTAYRPGDILTARNGLTVEINNTDAEGRLILADALALSAEDPPDLMVSMATLTGAARVAVGADIAPFFTDDDATAAALAEAGARVRDPVWRLPFHAPYEAQIEPGIADLDNAPKGGLGGAITAALFLRRFVGGGRYVHFDIYGWQPNAAPARPKGGAGQGTRALFEALPRIVPR